MGDEAACALPQLSQYDVFRIKADHGARPGLERSWVFIALRCLTTSALATQFCGFLQMVANSISAC
jgi:hypothetical protein